MMRFIIQVGVFLLRIIRLCCFLLVIATLTPLAKPYVTNYNSYTILKKMSDIEQSVRLPLKKAIGKVIPTRVAGLDLSRLYLIILVLILAGFLNSLIFRLSNFALYLREKRKLQDLQPGDANAPQSQPMTELSQKIDQLKHAKPKTRKELIEDIFSLKNQLNEMEKTMAFLSIDVVGSTAMKEKEDKLAIQHDFDRYNELVTQILDENHCIKFASTPDGIMAAFVKLKYAINSAQKLLAELKVFNDTEKKVAGAFSIRIGINSGKVLFDESEPLEKLSDRAVDIAGHLQKYAEHDAIYLSKTSYDALEELKEGFVALDKEIDGEKIYQWTLPNS